MSLRMALLAALAIVVAGCSGSSAPKSDDPTENTNFDDLDLEATDTTGIIRGIAVDDRIVPIEGAGILLRATDGDRETVSDAEGRFGFDDLPAGTYFLTASKLNYEGVQATVTVEAGVEDPPTTKVLLTRLFTVDPYSVASKFEGFIQCGWQVAGVSSLCFNDYETLVVPDIPPTLKEVFDNRGYRFDLDGNWSTLVFELTWEPTAQGTSPQMFVLVSYWNRTSSDWYGQATDEPPVALLRFESGEEHGSSSGDVIPPEGMVDMYAYGAITGSPYAVGISQDFTIIQHNFFYGKPPEEWSFVAGDEPPF